MKRLTAIASAIVLAVSLFTSCSGCIGIVDWGDPGPDGRPLNLNPIEEPAHVDQ